MVQRSIYDNADYQEKSIALPDGTVNNNQIAHCLDQENDRT